MTAACHGLPNGYMLGKKMWLIESPGGRLLDSRMKNLIRLLAFLFALLAS
jgi:hypothetical protein